MLRPMKNTTATSGMVSDEARRRLAEQMQMRQASASPVGQPTKPPAPKPAVPGMTALRPAPPKPGMPTDGSSRQGGSPVASAPPSTATVSPVTGLPIGTGQTGGVNAPGLNGQPAPKGNDDFDAEVRRLLADRLRSGGDTAEAERLIREQLETQLSGDLVNQRARMGRAGFGSSGAMAALEGDTMRAARSQMARDILGVRTTEDQRAFDNALAAIGADTDKRRAGTDESIAEAIMAMLADGEEGGADGAASSGPPPKGAARDVVRGVTGRNDPLYDGVANPGEKIMKQDARGGMRDSGRVRNTATNKDYDVRTMNDALSGDWVYSGTSFLVDGVRHKVYRDANGNTYAVPA